MKNESGKYSKVAIALAAVSFLVLGIFAGTKYQPNVEKAFGPTMFYQSTVGVEVDPKVMWAKVNNTDLYSGSSCLSTMTKASNAQYCGKRIWIADGKTISSRTNLKKYLEDKKSCIKPYEDGDMIVAPVNLKFKNANITVDPDDNTNVYIEAYVGTDHVIRWDNIKCWWCHIGQDGSQHTEVYGYGGTKYTSCTEGWIIGEAKSGTKVTYYKIESDGSLTPDNIIAFFFGPANSTSTEPSTEDSTTTTSTTN